MLPGNLERSEGEEAEKSNLGFRERNDPGTNTLLPLGMGKVSKLLGFSRKSPVLARVRGTGRMVLSLL